MEEQYRRICDGYAANHDFSGACLIRQGEKTLFSGAYGMAHKGFQVPNTLNTKFDTASVTKVFTAVAVLMLAEKGFLKLDDRIVDLVDLRGTEIPPDVTVEHLLTHTSGIADDADEEAGENYADLFVSRPNYSLRKTADFLPQFAYKKPLFRAGTNVRYNNCAFVLLGLAVEKLTGMEYRTFVEENIVKPCGLKNTEFCAMDGINSNTAEGYVACRSRTGGHAEWKKNIYSYPPVGSPDGGIYSTVEDLDSFLRSLRRGGLLSEPFTKLLFEPHCAYARPFSKWKPAPCATIRTGYGFEFVELDGRVFCIRKDGMNDGVCAMLSYYPQADATIVILANQDCDIWEMHRQLQTVLYRTFSKLKG